MPGHDQGADIPARFEELDFQSTTMGEISLRRRHDATADTEVYEVTLGDEFLMSSLFTAAETELARLGLAAVDGEHLSVLVGGLGLGHTARAVLAEPRVAELTVVEALAPVVDWHRRGLVPHADELTGDDRVRIVQGDFFASALAPPGRDADPAARWFNAILLDIDHSPRHLLNPAHAACYTPAGLARLAEHLLPGGAFAMWSDDPADEDFLDLLREVFTRADAHEVAFPDPPQGREATDTVYIANTPPD